MLEQALAEAETCHARRVTALHLVLYVPDAEPALRPLVAELSHGTPAQDAEVHIRHAPSNFICWNCCGLRFTSQDPDADCPNCGESGLLLPPDIVFALERIQVA